MSQLEQAQTPHAAIASPLVLADRLLRLAEDAERAGMKTTARRLVHLAHNVFEES